MQYVFSTDRTKRYKFPTHINDLVLDRSDSTTSEVFVVVLEPGKAPPLHKHDDTEQVFFIMQGEGVLTIGKASERFDVGPGDVVRIPPRTFHSIRCNGAETLKYLSIDCFVGGRPFAEPTWDSHVREMCREQGWNYDDVVI